MLKSFVLAALTAQGFAKSSMKTDDGNVLIRVDEGKTITFRNGNTSTGDIGAKLANQDALLTTLGERQNLADQAAITRDDTISDLAQKVTDQIAAQKAASDLSKSSADENAQNILATRTVLTNVTNALDGVSEDVDALEKDFTVGLTCVANNGVYKDGKCEDRPKNTFAMSSTFQDVRTTGCWQDVGGRSGQTRRVDSTKNVKVSYFDNIGCEQETYRSGPQCKWRMRINGKAFREHWSYGEARARGFKIYPTTIFNVYTNTEIPGSRPEWWALDSGKSYNWDIQACKEPYGGARRCINGWSNTNGAGVVSQNAPDVENGVTFQEVDPSLMAVRRYMSIVYESSSAWKSIGQRTVVYTPKTDKSMLEITYSDTTGMYQIRGSDACGLRLLINNRPHPFEHRSHSIGNYGWRINPTSTKWITKAEMKKGTRLTFQLQMKMFSGSGRCIYGYADGQSHNTFMVEEITPDAQKLMAVSPQGAFNDVRDKSKGWTNVAGRALAYTKKTASSLMKITLSDVWGFNQISGTTACQVRALVNGKTYGMGLHMGHSDNNRGYFIQPTVFTWVCKTCPVGKNMVTIQSSKQNGASECVFGWPSKAGFLKTEEYIEA